MLTLGILLWHLVFWHYKLYHHFLPFKYRGSFLKMAVSCRNTQRWIEIMYICLYLQVVRLVKDEWCQRSVWCRGYGSYTGRLNQLFCRLQSARWTGSVNGRTWFRGEADQWEILRSAHTVHLFVLCGSENKQRLFPYTVLTEWFL